MTRDTRPDDVERRALDAFRRGATIDVEHDPDDRAWRGFALRCALEAGRILRPASAPFEQPVELKSDGSPATDVERAVEARLRAMLGAFAPDAVFVGEESGGGVPDTGLAIAVDPVDGTWAFLGEIATWTTTIAVFRDGRPIAGVIASPCTGEVAHACRGAPARLMRLPMFGEPVAAWTLDAGDAPPSGPLLVNLHPAPDAGATRAALQDAWTTGAVRSVRSPGGSPAYGLLEAARGRHVYVNLWSKRPAEPFDLAAGVLLVRQAGGDVVGLDGAPIDPTRHGGPWIAAVDAEHRARIAALVASTLGA